MATGGEGDSGPTDGLAPGGHHAVLLDVGHGNAAIFFDGSEAIVVDAGSSDLVAETLERHGVRDIAALVISHRHHDHTSELPSLLANRDLCVRRLFINADPNRRPESEFEQQLRAGFNDSRQRNGTELQQANVTLGDYMSTEKLRIEVLAPTTDMALVGVGAKEETGGVVGPHALAVVLKVTLWGGRAVLLGSDLDHEAFRELIEDESVDISADLLVYPHHGGLTGAGSDDAEELFATDLTRAVNPDVVVFSNGRERFSNPRREVVRGVRGARESPRVRIVCTQLSKVCSAATFEAEGRLDPDLKSAGQFEGLSCSGSIRLDLSSDHSLLPLGSRHLGFVIDEVGPGAMCTHELTDSSDPPAT